MYLICQSIIIYTLFLFLLTELGAGRQIPPPPPPSPPRPTRPEVPRATARNILPAGGGPFPRYLLTTNSTGHYIPLSLPFSPMKSTDFTFFVSILDRDYWVRALFRIPYLRVMVNTRNIHDIHIMNDADMRMYPVDYYLPPHQRGGFTHTV